MKELFISYVIPTAVGLIFVLLPYKWCDWRGESTDDYGLFWRLPRRALIETLVITAVILSLLTLISMNWPYESLPRYSSLSRTLDLAMSGAGAAVIEEIFFRGWLYTIIRKRTSAAVSIVISSAIFAAAHCFVAQAPFLVAVFFPGAVMAWLRERYGNIGASTIFHACGNLWAIWFAPLVWPGSELLRELMG